MSNILDYIAYYGHRQFSSTAPFNILDALVFARFVYLPFSKIKIEDSETVNTLAQKLLTLKDAKFFWDDQKLLVAMSKSKRYQNLIVTDYIAKFDKQTVEQFAAIIIHLSDSEFVASFIGTDDSATGWREDFNMSIYDEVPAQKSAQKYCKSILKKYPKTAFRIVGHSKGGTLAMTAALAIDKKHSTNILSIDSFDGPGFSNKLAKELKNSPLLPRITNYVPQDSVIGRLFLHAEKITPVKSATDNIFLEHNLYTWAVDLKNLSFVPVELSAKSDTNERTFRSIANDVSETNKQLFVDVFFKLLSFGGYKNPAAVAADSLKSSIPKLLGSYRKLDKSERKIIIRAAKKFLATIIKEDKRKRKVKK